MNLPKGVHTRNGKYWADNAEGRRVGPFHSLEEAMEIRRRAIEQLQEFNPEASRNEDEAIRQIFEPTVEPLTHLMKNQKNSLTPRQKHKKKA